MTSIISQLLKQDTIQTGQAKVYTIIQWSIDAFSIHSSILVDDKEIPQKILAIFFITRLILVMGIQVNWIVNTNQ